MLSILKKFFTMDEPTSNPWNVMARPLKYREYQYSVAELERRLNAEVNGLIKGLNMWPYTKEENDQLS